LNNLHLSIPDLLSISMNITDIYLDELSISTEERMCELLDNRIRFGVKDMVGKMYFDYQYITDPPLLADIG
jgi:hypothetical protein